MADVYVGNGWREGGDPDVEYDECPSARRRDRLVDEGGESWRMKTTDDEDARKRRNEEKTM